MTPSERDGGAAEDDEDDDPAAGYVPLNALNLSSVAPQIVEFGKEEETVEEMGEKGRERRRRTRFIECLGADNVDLSASFLAFRDQHEELTCFPQLNCGSLPGRGFPMS